MVCYNNNFYIENFQIKYSETDCNLLLKPYFLLNFLQDAAGNNAEELGFGYSYMSSHNYAWFLIKYRMEFINYPDNMEELTVKTRPRGYNKLFAYREFELFNKDVLLGKVFSVWSVVDKSSRATVPIASAIVDNENMVLFVKQESDLVFSVIKAPENILRQKKFEVRYNDLDVNGHANNGNYIVWAMEPLDADFKNNHKIKTLDIVFKKEAKYSEELLVQVEFKNELNTVHIIKNAANEKLCLIECVWCPVN